MKQVIGFQIDNQKDQERFVTIERVILPQEIARRIMSLIGEGQIRPGEKLPPERVLAVMLGVSRPSVREALRALQLMRVVEVRQGDGTYVSSLTPELLARPLEIILGLLQDVTYLQILEARRMIEPGIAALAALRIDEEGLGRLRECLSRSEQAIADPEGFLDADMDLHSAIVEAAQNPLIVSLFTSIAQLGAATRKRTAYISGVRESTLENHRKIVEALASHDADRSREAMELHLSDVEERLRNTVEKGPSEETAENEGSAV